MKKYSVLSQTPMKWHKFLTYFYVPCSILCTLIALPATIESAELLKFTEYHLIGEIGLVATVVYLFVSICAVVGLAKHRWFGPCFLFAAYITLGIYHLIFLLIGNLWMADQLFLSKSFGQLLASLILLAINIPYYLKRRLLFSDGSAAPKAPSPTADSSVPPASDAQISSAPSYTPSEPPVNAPSFYLPTPPPNPTPAAQPDTSIPKAEDHPAASAARRPVIILRPAPSAPPHEEAPVPQSPSPRPHRKLRKGVAAAACCVLLIMIGALGFFAWNTFTLTQRLEDAALEEKTLTARIDSLEADLSFYTSKIGFVVQDSMYYHTRDCSIYKQADSFWAYNIEYCEYLDYTPCPICWPQ